MPARAIIYENVLDGYGNERHVSKNSGDLEPHGGGTYTYSSAKPPVLIAIFLQLNLRPPLIANS